MIMRNKKNATWKAVAWKFIAYPIVVVLSVFSFPVVFFTLLPTINNVGFMAFASSEDVFFNYYVLPFMCIDMCVVIGYLKLLRKISKYIITFFRERSEKKYE